MTDFEPKSDFPELEEPKEKTLAEYYLAKAKFHSENGRDVWLVDGITDEKRYYHKFDEETAKIASAFYKRGLRKGDTVIYMVKDLLRNYVLMAGVWRANGVMRASYPDDDVNTILSRVKESKVRFIVCEDEATERLQEVVEREPEWEVNIVTIKRNDKGLPSIQGFMDEDDGSECPEIDVTEDDPALILCTSGTTGMPKGAVHTHKSFLFQLRSMDRLSFTMHKPSLISTKATHISGSSCGFMLLGLGNTAVVVSDLTQDHIFNAAHKYKPGLVFAFPTFLTTMAGPDAEGYDFSSIETFLSGGSTITPAIRKTLLKLPNVKDVVAAYGLTECMMCTTSGFLTAEENGVSSYRDLPDFSVGKPYPGNSLQIRNPDTLEVMGANQRGEICIKSPGLFQSYLNNPEATKAAFIDEYFRTGDIGYFDSDGFVYIVDRSKEIFKLYNDHISPTELENVIANHPKVKEVCVVGVPNPGGHVPRAFISVHGNSSSEQEIAEEVKQYANANLAPYKQLRGGVFIVEELPKGKTGKITRALVEKLSIPKLLVQN